MIDGRKYITINTDAGISQHGVAAWACWIKSDYGTIKHSGVLRQGVTDSTMAEMMAISNALYIVSKTTYVNEVDEIIINTDSTGAIANLSGPQVNKKYAFIRSKFDGVARRLKPEIKFKHVYSHQPVKSTTKSREWVNNWCDERVRAHYKNN